MNENRLAILEEHKEKGEKRMNDESELKKSNPNIRKIGCISHMINQAFRIRS